MLGRPSVPRDLYDALQARYDALLEKYHALRLAGHIPRPASVAHVPPPPSPEERVMAEAAAEYERNVVDTFVAEGMSERDARDAARIMRQALDTSIPVLS